jgi:hypothetical protein
VRVRLGTVTITAEERKALGELLGAGGLASRATVKALYLGLGGDMIDDAMREARRKIEPVLPFEEVVLVEVSSGGEVQQLEPSEPES